MRGCGLQGPLPIARVGRIRGGETARGGLLKVGPLGACVDGGAEEKRLGASPGTSSRGETVSPKRRSVAYPARTKVQPSAHPMTDPDSIPEQLLRPHPERLSPADPAYSTIMELHDEAVAAGRPLYEDPTTGLWVMTAASLWGRPCCKNGCRHCPYEPRTG